MDPDLQWLRGCAQTAVATIGQHGGLRGRMTVVGPEVDHEHMSNTASETDNSFS